MAPVQGGMRIIALPLTTRATSSSRVSSVLPLTYYHFQTSPPKNRDKGGKSILKRATGKAAETWAGFGKAPEGNWKRRVFVYGEKLVDRIDFEELSLKSIDPSLGPRIGQLLRGDAEKNSSLVQIPLLYPPSRYFGHNSSSPLPHIRSLLSKRTPHHRKGLYIWLGIAPLTAPFALLPIIPNLPFFYAAWRAWSHYRAWKASQYLEGLINSNHVVPQPSPELDEVYTSHPPAPPHPSPHKELELTANPEKFEPDSTAQSFPELQPRLLLSQAAVPRILEIFELSNSTGADILRAIEQAKVRVERDAGR